MLHDNFLSYFLAYRITQTMQVLQIICPPNSYIADHYYSQFKKKTSFLNTERLTSFLVISLCSQGFKGAGFIRREWKASGSSVLGLCELKVSFSVHSWVLNQASRFSRLIISVSCQVQHLGWATDFVHVFITLIISFQVISDSCIYIFFIFLEGQPYIPKEIYSMLYVPFLGHYSRLSFRWASLSHYQKPCQPVLDFLTTSTSKSTFSALVRLFFYLAH